MGQPSGCPIMPIFSSMYWLHCIAIAFYVNISQLAGEYHLGKHNVLFEVAMLDIRIGIQKIFQE